jgi:hypothetical protein
MQPLAAGTTVFIVVVLDNDEPEVLSIGYNKKAFPILYSLSW